MRKPAVVVTAAVLLVATLATAGDAPATPAAPSTVLPGLAAPLPAGVPTAPRLPAVPDASRVTRGAPAAARPGVAREPAATSGVPTRAARAPGRDAGPRSEPGSPTATRPAAGAGGKPAARARPAARGGGKPAAGKPTRGEDAAFPAARRDVTTRQALSADPRGTVQQQALALVNKNRREGGCAGVSVDRRLIAAANRHAADMARRGYFAHAGTRGGRAGDRVREAGYRWSRYGENIARGQDSVAEVVEGWMNSPGHRENIMDCGLREVGLGLAFSAGRTPYWVQNFATPE